MQFHWSETEFWEAGLDAFNACVDGHNRMNSDPETKTQPGLPAWARGG